MGNGIIIKSLQDQRQWEIAARVGGSPSSTRAELWAITIAIKLVGKETKMTINTDSSSAIVAINGYTKENINKRLKKYKNPMLLQIITDMIKIKKLNLTFIKINALLRSFVNKVLKDREFL